MIKITKHGREYKALPHQLIIHAPVGVVDVSLNLVTEIPIGLTERLHHMADQSSI